MIYILSQYIIRNVFSKKHKYDTILNKIGQALNEASKKTSINVFYNEYNELLQVKNPSLEDIRKAENFLREIENISRVLEDIDHFDNLLRGYLKKGYQIDDIPLLIGMENSEHFKLCLRTASKILVSKIRDETLTKTKVLTKNIKQNKIILEKLKKYGNHDIRLNSIWIDFLANEQKLIERFEDRVNLTRKQIEFTADILKVFEIYDSIEDLRYKIDLQKNRLNSYINYANKYLTPKFIKENNPPPEFVKSIADIEKFLTKDIIYELINISYTFPEKINIINYGEKIRNILAELIYEEISR